VQLGHIISALARHHTVDVLSVRRGEQAYVEKMGNARILRVPVPDGAVRSRVDAFRRALRRQLEGADYDVIHVRDGWSSVPVLEMQPRLRYAVVYDGGRSPLTEPQLLDHDTYAQLERDENECLRRADLVLAATEQARQHFATIAQAERVRTVPPGVDVDRFDWDEPSAGPPRILYAGALTPGRGVRVLLRAMLDVASQSDARLTLAGRTTPEFLASLEGAVRDLGLTERVLLPGEVAHEDVPALIASATVCVSPGAADLSPGNPIALYPTKLLEYLACQRAVVAPRRSTVAMLLRDGQHGLLFEPGEPLDLAAKLLALLGDGETRAHVARAGYELVRRAHTASTTRRELRRAYTWLASISPWRERFTSFLDDLRTGDMPSLAPVEAIAAFEEDLVDEYAGQPDTGVIDGGEVTRVELNPLEQEDRSAGSYQPAPIAVTSGEVGDDWVVDDARIRREGALVALERAPVVDARFVAGEVEVPSAGEKTDPLRSLNDEMFSAIGRPLGFDADVDDDPGEVTATTTQPVRVRPAVPMPRPPPLKPVGTAPPPPAGQAPPPATSGSRSGSTPTVVVEPGVQFRVGTGDDTGP
jgi:glycosyltransferase involved in cell wall biosynthesis